MTLTSTFTQMLRNRRAEMEEDEVSFDDEDILAVAMDYLHNEEGWISPDEIAAKDQRIAELEAEKQLLQDILDGRPAINAGLPETYIRWSQSIYSGDIVRAQLNAKSK